jgi:hypothetical protein
MKTLGIRSIGQVSNYDYNNIIGGELIRKNHNARGSTHFRLCRAIKKLEDVVKKVCGKRRDWERPRNWEQINDL